MITSIDFASYFAYATRPNSNSQYAKDHTMALKQDKAYPDGTCQSKYLVRLMAEHLTKHSFEFFKSRPILVPVPGSSPRLSDALWVPQRIAEHMMAEGLGRAVQTCLKRAFGVPKSAFSRPSDRPKARKHYESFYVEALTDVHDLVLIDDVITRGATLLGAASRIKDRFPDATIRAFALIRAQSNSIDFKTFEDPVTGRIRLKGDETFRRP